MGFLTGTSYFRRLEDQKKEDNQKEEVARRLHELKRQLDAIVKRDLLRLSILLKLRLAEEEQRSELLLTEYEKSLVSRDETTRFVEGRPFDGAY